jgi:hypothetical protein
MARPRERHEQNSPNALLRKLAIFIQTLETNIVSNEALKILPLKPIFDLNIPHRACGRLADTSKSAARDDYTPLRLPPG